MEEIIQWNKNFPFMRETAGHSLYQESTIYLVDQELFIEENKSRPFSGTRVAQ